MSAERVVYSFPLEALAEARKGGPLNAQVRSRFGSSIPPHVHAFLSGEKMTQDQTAPLMESLAALVGRPLPCESFSRLRTTDCEIVDAALLRIGFPPEFSIARLTLICPPISGLINRFDAPLVGHVSSGILDEVERRFGGDFPHDEDNDIVDGVLSEMEDWFVMLRRQQRETSYRLGLLGLYFY